jgi:hypothetical protein
VPIQYNTVLILIRIRILILTLYRTVRAHRAILYAKRHWEDKFHGTLLRRLIYRPIDPLVMCPEQMKHAVEAPPPWHRALPDEGEEMLEQVTSGRGSSDTRYALAIHCTRYALYSLCTVLALHCTRYALYSLYTVLTMHCTLYSLYTVLAIRIISGDA